MLPWQHRTGREISVLPFHVLSISVCLWSMLHLISCFSVNLFIDLCFNAKGTLTNAGGHISLLGWHHLTQEIYNTAQLGSLILRNLAPPPQALLTVPLSSSTPTLTPTSAPLAIWRQRCTVRWECSSADTTCVDICGGLNVGKLKTLGWNLCIESTLPSVKIKKR